MQACTGTPSGYGVAWSRSSLGVVSVPPLHGSIGTGASEPPPSGTTVPPSSPALPPVPVDPPVPALPPVPAIPVLVVLAPDAPALPEVVVLVVLELPAPPSVVSTVVT